MTIFLWNSEGIFHYHSCIAFKKPKAVIVSDPFYVISSCLCYLLIVLNVVDAHYLLWWEAIVIHFMAHSGFFSI